MNKFFLLAAAVLAAIAFFAYGDLQEATNQASPWMNPVVTRAEFNALEWVKKNTGERTTFVTDIFGGELLMGETLREGTIGGDWAIVPNVVQRMYDIQYKFYESKDSAEAHSTAIKYNASFIWAPDRQVFAGYQWVYPNKQVLGDARFFEKVFDDGVEIYRVK